VDGSRPMERSACESNIMPVLVLKHSRIIQRRVMRARELRVLLLTEPPPTSVKNNNFRIYVMDGHGNC